MGACRTEFFRVCKRRRSCLNFLFWWGFLFVFAFSLWRFLLPVLPVFVAFLWVSLFRRFFVPCFWGIRDAFGSVLSLGDIVRCPGWLITTADTLHARERVSSLAFGPCFGLSFCASFGWVFWGVFAVFCGCFSVFSVGFGCVCRASVS